MRFLDLPAPIIAALVSAQVPEELSSAVPENAPEWALAVAAIIWVLLAALNQFGLLRNGDRRRLSFGESDRDKLDKLYNLLAHRDSDDGIERWLLHRQQTKHAMESLVRGQEHQTKILEELLDAYRRVR